MSPSSARAGLIFLLTKGCGCHQMESIQSAHGKAGGEAPSDPVEASRRQTSTESTTYIDPWKAKSIWKDVPDKDWNDYKWQMRNAIKTIDQLKQILPLTPPEEARLKNVTDTYHFMLAPYWMSLIDPNDPNDPIRLQSVPSGKELETTSYGEADSLDEKDDSPVPGLTHRYPNRVLMYTTNVCSMYCRFCTRKREWIDGDFQKSRQELDAMLDYIERTEVVRDVICSGGDPLMLSPVKLDYILQRLKDIPHVEMVRLGTRVPTTLPQKITPELVDILERGKKVWVQTHFNHPREVTPTAAAACMRLLRAGVCLNNHSVLMRGVNDDPFVMLDLMHKLTASKIRPYYIFHCDQIKGAEYFRTSIAKGLEIMEYLRGHTSGLAVPTYVVDAPGGGGKIPVMPNYIVSVSEERWVLRNYEGMMIAVEEPPRPLRRIRRRRDRKQVEGVARLLSGEQPSLIPEHLLRYSRRTIRAAESVQSSLPANG